MTEPETRSLTPARRPDEPPLPSAATRVTLFEDRAEVTRTARAQLAPGTQWVGLAGVTVLIDDDTLQARAAGERVKVLAARVLRWMHQDPAADRVEVAALETAAEGARRRVVEAQRALERARTREGRAAKMLAEWLRAVAEVPRGAAQPETASAWRAGYDALDKESREAIAATAAARQEHLRAQDDLAQAELRLREGLVLRPRHEAVVLVQLEATEAHESDIEVTYRTPCALWRPEHLARLRDDGANASGARSEGTIELVTYATAWQATGEAWTDVDVRFSTARPARAASPPPVQDDVLHARRKTDEERRTVTVEARDQAIALAGLERGARAVDEMPGVDDGGEPLTYQAREKVSLASDGLPFRVEVARTTVKAQLTRVLFPERAGTAHLRATATLSEGGPLLAGPVRVARGAGLVGRARVDFVGRGEPFELGFGADDSVRVRRVVIDDRDTVALLGTQVLKRTVKIYLSNLSSDARRIEVTERIPVSEIEEVTVSFAAPEGFRYEPRDGFARADVDLAPNGTKTLALTYEVRAGARVRMPF